MRHSTSALRPLAGAAFADGAGAAAVAGAAAGAGALAAGADASGLSAGLSVGLSVGLAGDGAVACSPCASSTATTLPSDSLSPTFTLSSTTRPAADDGTSIVALSDSSVTRPWSLATVSPTATSTSITGTSS